MEACNDRLVQDRWIPAAPLFTGAMVSLVALTGYSFFARTRRTSYASGETGILAATPTPLIDPTAAGIPAIDAAQPRETQTVTLALG